MKTYMTKAELIHYCVNVVTITLEQELPNNANKEYIMPEYAIVELGREKVDKAFENIKNDMLTACAIEQKGEKKCSSNP